MLCLATVPLQLVWLLTVQGFCCRRATSHTLQLLWLVQVVHHLRQAAVGVDIVSRHAAGVWPSSDLRSEIVVLAAGAPGGHLCWLRQAGVACPRWREWVLLPGC